MSKAVAHLHLHVSVYAYNQSGVHLLALEATSEGRPVAVCRWRGAAVPDVRSALEHLVKA